MSELTPIPTPQKKKLFSSRNIIAVIGIFIAINILFAFFGSATNEYKELQNTYTSFYYHDGSSSPIGHYRIRTNSIYYYQNCSDPFRMWCKHKLDGVKPGEFQPLSKDFAKVTTNGKVSIYNAHQDVTSKIANPAQFRALEKIEADPEYFTDGVYVYFLGESNSGTSPHDYTRSNRGKVVFPVKLAAGDVALVPEEFQEDYYHGRVLEKKVLFINDRVYLNGKLISAASASSFKRVKNKCLDNRVGSWFKDNTHVYYDGHIVSGADPGTFISHKFSNFDDENQEFNKQEYNKCDAYVGSDKNNVYTGINSNAECDSGEFCSIYEIVPGVSPKNMSVQNGRIISGEQFSNTITNDDGVFYLDGTRKNDDMKARIYISRDWGKEYREINARKGQYRIDYWIYSPECKAVSRNELYGTKTKETYELIVNSRVVDQVSRCEAGTRVTLSHGINVIELVSDQGEVVYKRNYEDVNW